MKKTLPKELATVLGVVIRSAAECVVQAIDSAGIGADSIQFKLKWADKACRIVNGSISHGEEHYHQCYQESPREDASEVTHHVESTPIARLLSSHSQ